jgi:hypothetical protein
MKYYYLTDDSEKSLAPFFSKMVLSASFFSAVGVGALLLMFWPHQPLAGFIIADKIPLLFFLIFSATLIIYSYVNLCCGCGDIMQNGYFIIKYRTDKSTYEKEIAFFRYGLLEFLLHTLILLLPFLPLLVLTASASAAGFVTFTKAVSILYFAALLCRMFGFMVYLFWGRSSTIGYFLARAFMIVFIFGTLLFAPFVNPIQYLYLLNETPTANGLPYVLYMMTVIFATLLLTAANHILVRRLINKEKIT